MSIIIKQTHRETLYKTEAKKLIAGCCYASKQTAKLVRMLITPFEVVTRSCLVNYFVQLKDKILLCSVERFCCAVLHENDVKHCFIQGNDCKIQVCKS